MAMRLSASGLRPASAHKAGIGRQVVRPAPEARGGLLAICALLVAVALPLDALAQVAAAPDSEEMADTSAPAPKSRTSIGYERSIHPDGGTGTNRLLVRQQSDVALPYDLLFRLDAKGTAYVNGDHIIEPSGKRVDGELRCRECYLQANFGKTSVKLGYQVLVWSEMNSLSGIDVTNRFDAPEFVYLYRDDARLGEPMLVAERFSELGTWTFFAKPNALPNKSEPAFGRYDLDRFYRDGLNIAPGKRSGREFGLRLLSQRENSDIALTAAHVADNESVFRLDTAALAPPDAPPTVRKDHRGYGLLAVSGNFSVSRSTFKGELVHMHQRLFQHRLGPEGFSIGDGVSRHNASKLVLAMEYSSLNNYFFAAEIANTRIEGWQPHLKQGRDRQEVFLLGNKRFFNDKLFLQYTFYRQLNDHFAFHEFKGQYSWSDSLLLGVLYHAFNTGNRAAFPIHRPERLTVSATYTL